MEAVHDLDECQEEIGKIKTQLLKLGEQKEAMEARISRLDETIQQQRAEVERLEADAEAIAQLEQVLHQSVPGDVSPQEMEAATDAKAAAMQAFHENESARANQQRLDRLKEAVAKRDAEASTAERLRRLAAQTESILVSQIGGGPIRYESGRLVVATDRSASELFADLSHGERAKIAIEVAAEHLPADGLMVIRQEVWESLQPANQHAIAEHARTLGVTVLTAAVADGEGIRVEQIGG